MVLVINVETVKINKINGKAIENYLQNGFIRPISTELHSNLINMSHMCHSPENIAIQNTE